MTNGGLPLGAPLFLALLAALAVGCSWPRLATDEENRTEGFPPRATAIAMNVRTGCFIYRAVDDLGQVVYFGDGSCGEIVLGPRLDGGAP